VIIGTAGHIDHGKTALLEALTGQAGDRRREERERGITIDLGYLYAPLTADAPLTGFIDVPGHERFIHNMLAGAQGIDLVLLVVAADDGVMPQTREHLAIVELLGIPELRVVISKCDRVESARIEQVRKQIRRLLEPGPYADAQMFEVSSHSGEGIDELRQALLLAQDEVLERSDRGGFRLDIDRAFSVSGAGIVVTGTALAGQVTVGDTLLLGQSGKPVRVRGLHAQNQTAAQAWVGQRVALNLSAEKLALEQIHRGDWLLAEWLFAPTQRIDIDLNLLNGETRNFEHFSPVRMSPLAWPCSKAAAWRRASACSPSFCSTPRFTPCMGTDWCYAIRARSARWAAAGCWTRLHRPASAAAVRGWRSCRSSRAPTRWSKRCPR